MWKKMWWYIFKVREVALHASWETCHKLSELHRIHKDRKERARAHQAHQYHINRMLVDQAGDTRSTHEFEDSIREHCGMGLRVMHPRIEGMV